MPVKKITIFCLFYIFYNTTFSFCQPDQQPHPFKPGERLSFSLRWNFVTAGTASAEVMPSRVIGGIPVQHFRLTARTTPFIDMLYKVRDRIDSYTDINMNHSLFYKKIQREGNYKRDVTVQFNCQQKLALYEDSRSKRIETTLHAGTFDPLAICYYFRLQNLEVGKSLAAPISDGKRCVLGHAKIIARERIKVPCGEFDSFLVQPEIKHLGGVFKRSQAATLHIWISADYRHLPLQVKSKVKVGSFLAVLTDIQEIKLVDGH